MKNWISAIIAVAIIATIFFFLGKCSGKEDPPDNSARIAELEEDTLRAGIIRDSLTALIDSLETIPPKIDRQIVIREWEIDENIASGISTPVGEYRRSLQDNQELPDPTEELSPREITLGAKYIARVPKLELKVKLYETKTIPALKADVKNYSFLYKSSQDLNKIKDVNLKQKDDEIERLSKWYNNKILWLGLGVVAAGLTVHLVK